MRNPGPIDNNNLKAPTGDEIQGTYELVPGASGVTFDVDHESGYDHTDDTKMFWDGSITQTIDGVPMFTDESGVDWLQHHLIPDEASPLSTAVLNTIQAELLMGNAVEACRKLVDAHKAMLASGRFLGRAYCSVQQSLVNAEEQFNNARLIYRELRDLAKQAIAAELAAQEPEE